MTKTHETPMPDVPAFLKRETNKRGVTLSAGVANSVVATGSKLAAQVVDQAANSKPVDVPKVIKTKAEKKAEAKAIKDAARAAIQAQRAAEKALKAAGLKATPVTAEPALGPDGQPLVKVSRSIVPMRFKDKYKGHAGTCGDDMALELKAATTTRNADKREVLDVEALWAIAKANEIDVSKYVALNNGQKRMNVGNKLRGALAAGRDVVIGTRQFKAEDYEPRH